MNSAFGRATKSWLIAFFIIAVIPSSSVMADPPIPTTLPAVPSANDNRLSQSLAVQVKSFRFHGNTVFTDAQLAAIAEPIRKAHDGRMTSQDMEAVRTAITLTYVNKGYINSGAVLPDQIVIGGVIRFDIIEGRLTAVHLQRGRMAMAGMYTPPPPATQPSGPAHGLPAAPGPGQLPQEAAQPLPTSGKGEAKGLLNDDYITSRVKLGAGPPLNVLQLKDQLELLRRDPNIDTVNAELAPGDSPGESVLNLAVTERNPLQFGVEYDNNRPPSVGAYELDLLASDSDLTGHGDALAMRWGVMAGAADSFTYNRGNDYSFDYTLPLTARELTLELNYTRSSDVVVETPFAPVNIQSKTDSIYATLRQPLVRTVEDPALSTRDQELAALLTVSSRYNRTFLLGEPFSFSPGADNGVEDAFALRPALEYFRRSSDEALALRATLTAGIDGPHATLHDNGTPDGRFVAFLAQSQYIHRLPLGTPDQAWNDAEGVLRFNGQLTPDRLLTVEQFSLGGVDTVRGYRQNELVTDNALQASAELRVPVVKSNNRDVLSLVPFLDSGYAWNRDNRTQTPQWISSAGCGLVFTPSDQITADIYYGYPFKHFSHAEDDLQDMGIFFDVKVLTF